MEFHKDYMLALPVNNLQNNKQTEKNNKERSCWAGQGLLDSVVLGYWCLLVWPSQVSLLEEKRQRVAQLPLQGDQSLWTGHCSPQQFKGQSPSPKGREGASTCRPRHFAPGCYVAPLGGRGAADCFLSELFWLSLKFWLKVLSTEAGFIRHHVTISQTVRRESIKLRRWTVRQIYP